MERKDFLKNSFGLIGFGTAGGPLNVPAPALEYHQTMEWLLCPKEGAGSVFEEVDTNIRIVTAIGGKGMTASSGLAESNIQKIFNR